MNLQKVEEGMLVRVSKDAWGVGDSHKGAVGIVDEVTNVGALVLMGDGTLAECFWGEMTIVPRPQPTLLSRIWQKITAVFGGK